MHHSGNGRKSVLPRFETENYIYEHSCGCYQNGDHSIGLQLIPYRRSELLRSQDITVCQLECLTEGVYNFPSLLVIQKAGSLYDHLGVVLP